MSKNLFICFEGIDGIGKSTQTKLAYERLKSEIEKVEIRKEPGGNKVGELIRKLLLEGGVRDFTDNINSLLYMADHIENNNEVTDLLSKGFTVVQDRFMVYSHEAYWNNATDKHVHDEMHTNCVYPDLTILMTGDVGTSLERARNRKDKKFLVKPWSNVKSLEAIQERYLSIARAHPSSFVIVNSDLENDDEDVVSDYIYDIVRHKIDSYDREDK